jgi:hypothetical protein
MKNIYQIGAYQVKQEDFRFQLYRPISVKLLQKQKMRQIQCLFLLLQLIELLHYESIHLDKLNYQNCLWWFFVCLQRIDSQRRTINIYNQRTIWELLFSKLSIQFQQMIVRYNAKPRKYVTYTQSGALQDGKNNSF